MKRAIFLDRDGTLIEDRGHLRDPSGVVFFRDAVPALRLLNRYYDLFVVTNQPGIAEGVLRTSDVEKVNRYVAGRLADAGVKIKEMYFCPHARSEGCECIKPKPYYLRLAAAKYGIEMSGSFFIGDHPHDVETARNAGARGIYVLTGHGEKHRGELPPGVTVVKGILEAAVLAAKEASLRDTACGSDKDIERAAAILRDGGIVAFPTETVYGLGADAFNPRAVARVFEAKRRPLFDPLIVHVATTEMAGALAAEFPDAAWKLVESFWPGPLTLVLPKSARVPDIVTAGLPTVALRMPDHPIALAMIVAAGVPVAAPSANPFGRLSPTTADHVRVEIGSGADMVLDGGRCRVGIESSIVSLAGDRPVLLRCGGVPAEEIEKVTGPVEPAPDAPGRPQAPGMLARHYAPRTPLERRPPGMSSAPPGTRAGLLSFDLPAGRADGFAAVEILSPSGDLREAAANLFAALRRLDSLSLDVIFFDPVPERGLGAAINDRLAKASRPGDAATCDGGARPG